MPLDLAAAWKARALYCALGLVVAASLLALFWTRYPNAAGVQLTVLPPPTQSTALPSRCPPRTLEDHGICIPVPVTQEQESVGDLIPLLPGRPSSLDAYHLPVPGRAELIGLQQAEVAARFAIAGQALAISVPTRAALDTQDLIGFEAALVVDSDPLTGWLLLYLERPSPSLILLSGLNDMPKELPSGKPLPRPRALGTARQTFFMAARQLRAEHAEPTADMFRVGASVPTDIRNLLQLRSNAGQAAP